MIFLIFFQTFAGGGIGGFYGHNEAFTVSLDFGKTINPTLDFGTKFTMSWTENAPSHYDIDFYNWGDPGEYPRDFFSRYRERNEVAAQLVARKYFNNLILIGLSGISLQEYIVLPTQDSLPPYPLGEEDVYYFVFGAGLGIRIASFDFCLTYSNRYGPLLYITRQFGSKKEEIQKNKKY